ncbi:MAG: hypothetical protein GEU99_20325 [Luteitalea sp.]|nr:hypothetical protein [Luteitalea sp.]
MRERLGEAFHISGGWAVPQFIEALDRGVDAMVPESAMTTVYCDIDRTYRAGHRALAVQRFRRLLPILAFANQEITLSIAFFKRLLVRKRIFSSATLRRPGFAWDRYNMRIADELIDAYIQLETELSTS